MDHPFYTIGHSTRTIAEFCDLLRVAGARYVADVRTVPRSRTNPQFNLDVLPATLEREGIAYVHLASLGGRRSKSKHIEAGTNAGWERQPFHNYADYAETDAFREGLGELLQMASRETCAIMCAEAVWWRCHRRIVADHVLAHGVPVVHVFSEEKNEPASLTPFAVIGARSRVSYPAPTQRPKVVFPASPVAGGASMGPLSIQASLVTRGRQTASGPPPSPRRGAHPRDPFRGRE